MRIFWLLAGTFYVLAFLGLTTVMVVSSLSEAFVDHPAILLLLGPESPFMWLGIGLAGALAIAFKRADQIEQAKRYPRR